MKRHGLSIKYGTTCARVAVPRLAHAADIDDRLLWTEAITGFELLSVDELTSGGDDTRHVSMPHETVTLNQGEDFFEFLAVVHVLGKDVFVQWVAGLSVHK